jgi:hypothetical protein
MEMIVLSPTDIDTLLMFENEKIAQNFPQADGIELKMQSWHAPWRQEALEFYLPLGWSFGLWSDSRQIELLGYVLTQPLLFVGAMTQSLWVEHMSAKNDEVMVTLFDIAYRWARDKHFQHVLVSHQHEAHLTQHPKKKWNENMWSIPTSKLRML